MGLPVVIKGICCLISVIILIKENRLFDIKKLIHSKQSSRKANEFSLLSTISIAALSKK